MKFDYSGLSLTDLIEKIRISNFFNLPRMVAEAFKKLQALIPTPQEPSYKVYTALLTQSGTDAPVATVLENTLGEDITFSYATTGVYNIVSTTLIDLDKVVIFIQNSGQTIFEVYPNGANDFRIITYLFDTPSTADELLYLTPIEIRVYN